MKTSTVNISFNKELLSQIDKVAKQESRSRSELIREAARAYIERKEKWGSIFSYAGEQVKNANIAAEDINKEISEYRKSKRDNK